MAVDLNTLISQLESSGAVAAIANNRVAQFGTPVRRYLGAEILPERFVDENIYRQELVRHRTVIANDAGPYTPVQLQGTSTSVASILVELQAQDTGTQVDGQAFDALVRMANRGQIDDLAAELLRIMDLRVNRGLIEKIEKQRWEAIIEGSVTINGQNRPAHEVALTNPAGHRVAAGGDWQSDAYDPFDDIAAIQSLMASAGIQLEQMVTRTPVITTMARNAKVASRAGRIEVDPGTGAVTMRGNAAASVNAINNELRNNGLPVFQTYDLTYRTEDNAVHHFIPDGTIVFIGRGEQDPETFANEGGPAYPVTNPLGYTALGRAAGAFNPGRVIRPFLFTDKPPRFKAEGWQMSAPVIVVPEAIAVIHSIDTTP